MPFEAAAMKDLLVWISHVCPCVSVYFLQVLLFPPTVQRHTAHLTDWQVFHEYWYISFEQKTASHSSPNVLQQKYARTGYYLYVPISY